VQEVLKNLSYLYIQQANLLLIIIENVDAYNII